MIKNTIVIIMVIVIIIKLNETHMLNNVDKDTDGDSCSSNLYFLIASGISLHTFCAIVGCFSLLLIRVLP